MRALSLALLMACKPEPAPDTGEPPAFGDALGSITAPGSHRLTADRDHVFLCQSDGVVVAVNIDDPTAPAEVGTITSEGGCVFVGVYSGTLYVFTGSGEVALVNPANLFIESTFQSAYSPVTASLHPGTYTAWVAHRTETGTMLEALDIRQDHDVSQRREHALDGVFPLAIGQDNDVVVLVDETGTVHVFDHDFTPRGTWTRPEGDFGPPTSLQVVDGVLYLPHGDGGLWLVDLTDPDAPATLSRWDGGATPAWDLVRIDDRMYVGIEGGLAVLDLARPAAPELVPDGLITPDIGGETRALMVDRSVGYALDPAGGRVAIVDVLE